SDGDRAAKALPRFGVVGLDGRVLIDITTRRVALVSRLGERLAPGWERRMPPEHCIDVQGPDEVTGRIWPLLGWFGGKLRMRLEADGEFDWLDQQNRQSWDESGSPILEFGLRSAFPATAITVHWSQPGRDRRQPHGAPPRVS